MPSEDTHNSPKTEDSHNKQSKATDDSQVGSLQLSLTVLLQLQYFDGIVKHQLLICFVVASSAAAAVDCIAYVVVPVRLTREIC